MAADSDRSGGGKDDLSEAVVNLLLGRKGAAKALLSMGADPSEPLEGVPMYHMAVGLESAGAAIENLMDFLDAGADVDAPDADGHALLRKVLVSARPGWEELAGELCRRGADPDAGGERSAAAGLLAASGYSREALAQARSVLGELRAAREKAALDREGMRGAPIGRRSL